MDDDKVLITFRVSSAQKRQLEYLAQKAGQSITQYLILLLKGEIENTLIKEGYAEAFEQAAIKAGIEQGIARAIAISTEPNRLDEVKKMLNEEMYALLLDEFLATWREVSKARYQVFTLEDNIKTNGDLFRTHKYV